MGHARQEFRGALKLSAAKHLLGCVLALLAASCAASDKQSGQPELAPTAGRIYVEAILTVATADERRQWAGQSFGQITALLTAPDRWISNPHVLATRGERAVLEFPSNQNEGRAAAVVRYEVLAEAGEHPDFLTIHFNLRFGDGQTANAKISTDRQRVVVVPLENGLTLVAQAEAVNSRADLRRIYERKVKAVNAERHQRGQTGGLRN